MEKVLLTGGLGFIGKNVLSKLVEENIAVYLLVRPKKEIPTEFRHNLIHPIFVDLADSEELIKKIKDLDFDTVLHIGAVRGGRNFSREIYKKVNVDATEIIAKAAVAKSAKFVFCSSVGVFGAIPKELPPTEQTERQEDNYYHYTKILAERKLHAIESEGLNFVIIRPAITYGVGDFGFPYSLIKLIDKGHFLNCTTRVKINMVDVQTLSQAFINAAKLDIRNGAAYNICDKNPIEIKKLVDFISRKLYGKDYPKFKTLPAFVFRFSEFVFDKILKNELWKARFQLISKSWYYDPKPAEADLHIQTKDTIPNFDYVIEWYKEYTKKGI